MHGAAMLALTTGIVLSQPALTTEEIALIAASLEEEKA